MTVNEDWLSCLTRFELIDFDADDTLWRNESLYLSTLKGPLIRQFGDA